MGEKKKSTAGSEARIEVAASEISAAPGTSIIIISYINLEAIFFCRLFYNRLKLK